MKYTLGSHDDIGDLKNGDAEDGLTNWDRRHRYFVDQLGGRDELDRAGQVPAGVGAQRRDAGHADAVHGLGVPHGLAARLVGVLARRPRTRNGDHRFNWAIAGDPIGMEMRRLVAACNAVRWQNPALRADSLTDHRTRTRRIRCSASSASSTTTSS